MNYTDTQLKQALAKMLPEKILVVPYKENYEPWIVWKDRKHEGSSAYVLNTEILHLCWLVEETLDTRLYSDMLKAVIQDDTSWKFGAVEASYQTCHATWQQRVTALAKVKGIEL